MKKPEVKSHSYFDLEAVIAYLETEHKITPGLWDWLCYTVEPREDSGFWTLHINSWLKYIKPIPNDIRRGLKIMLKEFGDEQGVVNIHANWQ